ncbi:MAG: 3-phosphoshikimate 1-carboxyvinyltransferase, partial [Acidimicrobiia bacterium]|nr:3-phosphoshikimate 1-carboxyvinyltransferase [Acidimicrobiia bacterium]
IVPFDGPARGRVRPPGSKSITNRALLVAALAEGRSVLTGTLVAEDTEAMLGCIVGLGADVTRAGTTVTVDGLAGAIPSGRAHLHAAQSGTTARFVAATLLLSTEPVTLDADEAMRRRPMSPTIDALRALGAEVVEDGEAGHLPFTIRPALGSDGAMPVLHVPGEASSQFASGLLIVATCLPQGLRLVVDGDLVSRPYLEMTVSVMRHFGAAVDVVDERTFVVAPGRYRGTAFDVEPDASGASYFFAAAAITGGRVTVDGLGSGSIQGDLAFVDVLARMGAGVSATETATTVEGGALHGIDVDLSDISDTAQTLAAVAAFADTPSRLGGIGFIRAKETDRIGALVTELGALGLDVIEEPDGLRITPGAIHGGLVRTWDDHRMAMSMSLVGLRVPGVVIDDPGCVAKTFPTYFELLESLRPEGRQVQVIAIDGPAGSGKSTVARAVAARCGLGYLDTGAMYRSVAFAALHGSVAPDDAELVANLARHMELSISPDGRVVVDGIDATIEIRGPEVTRAVSIVAANPAVREEMRARQRQWAVLHGGGVMEGRDIGTVVFPDARLKVYLDASPEVRAARRSKEVADLSYETVATELARRDALDTGRSADPLRTADDAVVIDTSDLTVEEIVDRIMEHLG